MQSTFATVLALLSVAAYASAHGIVTQVTVAGKVYQAPPAAESGNNPDSIVRQVPNNGPVPSSSDAMACGRSQPAALVADANPGDSVVFQWSQWPHQLGPIINYMASCGDTPCNQFDASQAKWFKVDQQGAKEDGTWVQLEVSQGKPTAMTIPKNLAPGGYLLRHEIIAMHNAVATNGAEFYPSCTQLNIGGAGTGTPAASELVSFPGAYSPDSPSLKGSFDPYAMRSGGYVFPGPPVAAQIGAASPREGATKTGSEPASPAATEKPKTKCKVRRSKTLTRRSPLLDNLRNHRRAIGKVFSSHSR